MRRRAEIEAFKLERLREQCRHERELNRSRRRTHSQSSISHDDTSSVASSSFQAESSPRRRLTPSQRKDHLVSLRKQIVLGTAGEMLDMRNRSMSPRAMSDSYWALQPSYSAPQSPARSESPGIGSSGPDRFIQIRRGSNCSWHATNTHPKTSPARSLPDTTERRSTSLENTRPHSVEPLLSSQSMVPTMRSSMSTDLRTNVIASLSGPDMSADRLIQESNNVRRQNQRQIQKAQEMLRHLDEKRGQIKSCSQPLRSSQSPRKSQSTGGSQERHRTNSETSTPLSSSTEFRIRFSRELAPGQTSSPRVPSAAASSFTEYARDHLVRGQRLIDSWGTRPPLQQPHRSYFPRYDLGTGGYFSESSSSLDNHRSSDHWSPVRASSRRVTSRSPAPSSLSPENNHRTSFSADSAGRSSSLGSSASNNTALYRSPSAYHSSNYLRPLSMNYPAHRHLGTNIHTSSSGYRTDPEDHGLSSSSRSSSIDHETSGRHGNIRSLQSYRSDSHRMPIRTSLSSVENYFPRTPTSGRTCSSQTHTDPLNRSSSKMHTSDKKPDLTENSKQA